MEGRLSEHAKFTIWKSRNRERKRVIRTLSRILNEATRKDYEFILQLIDDGYPVYEILNAASTNLEGDITRMVAAERRMTRFVIGQFNGQSEYPDVIFTEYFRQLTDKIVRRNLKQMNTTTRERTGELILNIDNVSDEVAEEVKQKYLKDRYDRADVMSWTTTTQVASETDNQIYQQSEFVEKKQWYTQGDDRVRPAHKKLNGEIVPKDQNFSNGLPYPQEFRCRCGIYAVFKDEDQVIEELLATSGEG